MLLLTFVVPTYISSDLKNDLEEQITPLMEKVIEWRHDIHQYPELSNRELIIFLNNYKNLWTMTLNRK